VLLWRKSLIDSALRAQTYAINLRPL